MPPPTNKNLVYILKNTIVRQNWKPVSLYNLTRVPRVNRSRTIYQQKFTAKKLTRKYHGEKLTTRQWKTLFKRSMASVVPMSTQQLAETDGSQFGAGRGSGLNGKPQRKPGQEFDPRGPRELQETPYMLQTYAPLERRLDIAIFRAMFASSATQARQFVVHGFVEVNGQKMIYPQYLLNPGDMFSVSLPKILYATGLPKAQHGRVRVGFREKFRQKYLKDRLGDAYMTPKERRDRNRILHHAPRKEFYHAYRAISRGESPFNPNWGLRLKGETKEQHAARIAREMREYNKQREKTKPFGKGSSPEPSAPEASASNEVDVDKVIADFEASDEASESTSVENAEDLNSNGEPRRRKQKKSKGDQWFEDENLPKEYNPDLPYRTPWKPRHFLSAFAFIPKYLEVNHNTGHAVYLRHPVARPGQSEVPTPFDHETHRLAFNWWLRSGR